MVFKSCMWKSRDVCESCARQSCVCVARAHGKVVCVRERKDLAWIGVKSTPSALIATAGSSMPEWCLCCICTSNIDVHSVYAGRWCPCNIVLMSCNCRFDALWAACSNSIDLAVKVSKWMKCHLFVVPLKHIFPLWKFLFHSRLLLDAWSHMTSMTSAHFVSAKQFSSAHNFHQYAVHRHGNPSGLSQEL